MPLICATAIIITGVYFTLSHTLTRVEDTRHHALLTPCAYYTLARVGGQYLLVASRGHQTLEGLQQDSPAWIRRHTKSSILWPWLTV